MLSPTLREGLKIYEIGPNIWATRLKKTGDSMYFTASTPHGYRRNGATICAAIVVTSR